MPCRRSRRCSKRRSKKKPGPALRENSPENRGRAKQMRSTTFLEWWTTLHTSAPGKDPMQRKFDLAVLPFPRPMPRSR